MHSQKLGSTDNTVSEIGVGAWASGGAAEASRTPLGCGKTSDEESLSTISARALGVTFDFYDTEDSYGSVAANRCWVSCCRASTRWW